MAKKGKSLKIDDKFFFKVDPTIRVSKDRYNINVSQIMTSKDGSKREVILGHVNTFNGVIDLLKRNDLCSKDDIRKFEERTKEIQTSYKIGKLIVTVPENLAYDDRDVLFIPEPEEIEEVSDEP